MPHGRFGFLIPQVLAYRLARNGLQGRFGHELSGGIGHHYLHAGAALTESPYEFRGLVGGDSARDTEDDVLLMHSASLALPEVALPANRSP